MFICFFHLKSLTCCYLSHYFVRGLRNPWKMSYVQGSQSFAGEYFVPGLLNFAGVCYAPGLLYFLMRAAALEAYSWVVPCRRNAKVGRWAVAMAAVLPAWSV